MGKQRHELWLFVFQASDVIAFWPWRVKPFWGTLRKQAVLVVIAFLHTLENFKMASLGVSQAIEWQTMLNQTLQGHKDLSCITFADIDIQLHDPFTPNQHRMLGLLLSCPGVSQSLNLLSGIQWASLLYWKEILKIVAKLVLVFKSQSLGCTYHACAEAAHPSRVWYGTNIDVAG